DTLLEAHLGRPAEHPLRLVGRHDLAPVVAGACRDVLDVDLAPQNVTDRLDEAAKADHFGALEVEDLVAGPFAEGEDVRFGQVLDVDVVAHLRTVAVHRYGLAGERAADEAGEHERVAHAWPVRDAVAEDRELLA